MVKGYFLKFLWNFCARVFNNGLSRRALKIWESLPFYFSSINHCCTIISSILCIFKTQLELRKAQWSCFYTNKAGQYLLEDGNVQMYANSAVLGNTGTHKPLEMASLINLLVIDVSIVVPRLLNYYNNSKRSVMFTDLHILILPLPCIWE
jgi:hypothetical protein